MSTKSDKEKYTSKLLLFFYLTLVVLTLMLLSVVYRIGKEVLLMFRNTHLVIILRTYKPYKLIFLISSKVSTFWMKTILVINSTF